MYLRLYMGILSSNNCVPLFFITQAQTRPFTMLWVSSGGFVLMQQPQQQQQQPQQLSLPPLPPAQQYQHHFKQSRGVALVMEDERRMEKATSKRDANSRSCEDDTVGFTCEYCCINMRFIEDRFLVRPAKDLHLEGYVQSEYEKYVFCSCECFCAFVRLNEHEHIAIELVRLATNRYREHPHASAFSRGGGNSCTQQPTVTALHQNDTSILRGVNTGVTMTSHSVDDWPVNDGSMEHNRVRRRRNNKN